MLMESRLFEETKTKQKMVGQGMGFERIRRITGYLVGTVISIHLPVKSKTLPPAGRTGQCDLFQSTCL